VTLERTGLKPKLAVDLLELFLLDQLVSRPLLAFCSRSRAASLLRDRIRVLISCQDEERILQLVVVFCIRVQLAKNTMYFPSPMANHVLHILWSCYVESVWVFQLLNFSDFFSRPSCP